VREDVNRTDACSATRSPAPQALDLLQSSTHVQTVPQPALKSVPPRSPVTGPIGAQDLCHPMPHRLPFTGQGWIFELKHDGFRALARSGSAVQLLSRSGRLMTDPFPEIVAALEQLPDGLVLDGELVVPAPDGRSDFEEVRRRNLIQRPRMVQEAAAKSPAVLIVFDLLESGGEDLRTRPLLQCRRRCTGTSFRDRGCG